MKTRDGERNDDKRLEHGFGASNLYVKLSSHHLPFFFLCLIEVPYCSPFKVIRSKIKDIVEDANNDLYL